MENDIYTNPFVIFVLIVLGMLVLSFVAHRNNLRAQRRAALQVSTAAPSGVAVASGAVVTKPVAVPTLPTKVAIVLPSLPVSKLPLSKVAAADNIAIIGPKGSGKTTLLLTILAHRGSDCIAFDPHDSPGKWPCQTIGRGRDYPAIKSAIASLDRMMSERFRQLGDGEVAEGDFSRRTMVSDEFRSIATNLPGTKGQNPVKGAGDYLLDRIAEGRKVGETALLACHNDTVEALGIQGNSDMKTCFDYFIYTGGMAVQRYRQRGNVSPEAVEALQAMSRQYVVWDTERDLWFILNFDLEPVFVSAAPVTKAADVVLPLSDVGQDTDDETSLQTAKPVYSEGLKTASLGGLQTSLQTSSETSLSGLSGLEAIDAQTARRRLIKSILDANPGISKNAVHGIVKGDKTELLAMIDEIRGI